MEKNDQKEKQEQESLKDEMQTVIEEARMVLPGIQALIGFQTMAVFNTKFDELSQGSRSAYLIALGFLTLSMGLLMTPAAYHRLAERGKVSRRMINLSSTLITSAMVPLLLAFSLDVYVVVLAVLRNLWIASLGGIATFCLLVSLWFFFPLFKKYAHTSE